MGMSVPGSLVIPAIAVSKVDLKAGSAEQGGRGGGDVQPSWSSWTSVLTPHFLAASMLWVLSVAHLAPMQPEVSMAFWSESAFQPKT